jgi:hypothetical protein
MTDLPASGGLVRLWRAGTTKWSRPFNSTAKGNAPSRLMHNPYRSHTIHRSLARLWQVYPPHADLRYMQSLSRSGLLETRIETTLQVRLNPYLLDRKALDICVSQFVNAESDQLLPNPHTLLAHLPLHFCSWRRRSNGAI